MAFGAQKNAFSRTETASTSHTANIPTSVDGWGVFVWVGVPTTTDIVNTPSGWTKVGTWAGATTRASLFAIQGTSLGGVTTQAFTTTSSTLAFFETFAVEAADIVPDEIVWDSGTSEPWGPGPFLSADFGVEYVSNCFGVLTHDPGLSLLMTSTVGGDFDADYVAIRRNSRLEADSFDCAHSSTNKTTSSKPESVMGMTGTGTATFQWVSVGFAVVEAAPEPSNVTSIDSTFNFTGSGEGNLVDLVHSINSSFYLYAGDIQSGDVESISGNLLNFIGGMNIDPVSQNSINGTFTLTGGMEFYNPPTISSSFEFNGSIEGSPVALFEMTGTWDNFTGQSGVLPLNHCCCDDHILPPCFDPPLVECEAVNGYWEYSISNAITATIEFNSLLNPNLTFDIELDENGEAQGSIELAPYTEIKITAYNNCKPINNASCSVYCPCAPRCYITIEESRAFSFNPTTPDGYYAVNIRGEDYCVLNGTVGIGLYPIKRIKLEGSVSGVLYDNEYEIPVSDTGNIQLLYPYGSLPEQTLILTVTNNCGKTTTCGAVINCCMTITRFGFTISGLPASWVGECDRSSFFAYTTRYTFNGLDAWNGTKLFDYVKFQDSGVGANDICDGIPFDLDLGYAGSVIIQNLTYGSTTTYNGIIVLRPLSAGWTFILKNTSIGDIFIAQAGYQLHNDNNCKDIDPIIGYIIGPAVFNGTLTDCDNVNDLGYGSFSFQGPYYL